MVSFNGYDFILYWLATADDSDISVVARYWPGGGCPRPPRGDCGVRIALRNNVVHYFGGILLCKVFLGVFPR